MIDADDHKEGEPDVPKTRTVQMLVAAGALLLCAEAQGELLDMTIDGKLDDWPRSTAIDTRYDVQPAQVAQIDVANYRTRVGVLRPDIDAAAADSLARLVNEKGAYSDLTQFIFLMQFLEPVFGGSIEAGGELLFDGKPERSFGQELGRWSDSATPFRPDSG